MGKRVLLFGASGFLGTQVAAALADDHRTGEVVRAGRRIADVRHDLVADGEDALVRVLREVRPDAVVNAAGRLAGTDAELVEANVLTTARLLGAVQTAVPDARLVLLGSAAEYGAVEVGRRVTEDTPTRPLSAYGVTRLASTQLAALAAASGRVDVMVLRVFNPIGPGLPTENLLGKAAAQLHEALRTGKGRIRLGPLGACRDFVDVRDVGRAVATAALTAPVQDIRNRVLNVGSGTALPSREAVWQLARAAGFTGAIEEADPPPARSAGVPWIAADISRIGRVLDWAPSHDLTASTEATWQATWQAVTHEVGIGVR
jgi:nucleoside-diphosphate-sugar epimerase